MNPDHDIVINYGAVLAAAVAKFALGALWYTALFGMKWAKLEGIKMDKNMPMGKPLTIDFVQGLVYAYALACVADMSGILGNWRHGLCLGIFIGVGFNATVLLAANTWRKKPFKLFLIDASYQVLVATLMSVIIAAFTKAPEMKPPGI